GSVGQSLQFLEMGRVTPAQFGAVGDGASHPLSERYATLAEAQTVYPHAVALSDEIDWAALQAAVDSGAPVHIPSGDYQINRGISSTGSLQIAGDGATSIIRPTAAFTGTSVLSCVGSLVALPNISSVSAGSLTIDFASTPNLVAGDVFIIYNPTDSSFSGFRTSYRAGEFCEVRAVSGNTVTIRSALYAAYDGATVAIYKVVSGVVDIASIQIVGGTVPMNGLLVEAVVSPRVDDVTVTLANNAGVYFARCYDAKITNSNISNIGDGGDDYGIIFGNCHDGGADNCKVYARRHAIATGGDAEVGCVPVRNVRMRNCTLRNDITSGTHCADFHGNAEDCSYENCTIYGGATWQGKDISYRHCTITNASGGWIVISAEILGGTFLLDQCTLYTTGDPQPGNRGVIDVGGNSAVLTTNTTQPCNFLIQGGSLRAPSLSTSSYLLRARLEGSTVPVNIQYSGQAIDVGSLGKVLQLDITSGSTSPEYLIVENLAGLPSGITLASAAGGFASAPMRMPVLGGRVQVTTATNASSVTAPVTFRYIYPKAPTVQVTKTDRSYAGNRVGVAIANPTSASGATLGLFTDDGTNFSSAVTNQLNWQAGIYEV
nr:Chain A, tail spike protein gp49 [Pseudomonas phage LKA1]4RU4_B Chain B, tail spike protein gp49 [Pseudomonas phage LKA1]4RU4_C Chain C, tail spike protein gp49 [Pseudomonas phage LKA1]4RU4_D Chain D, tail spike protein gp49 [Pseudomonas phage LKA1]4RU4_E Chain E, tail spike protein gp49 [Pseudomonas phage LKA1]4RU4_F Chain F, tail spike protein gp49 [Pseudomonas phage LKA1]